MIKEKMSKMPTDEIVEMEGAVNLFQEELDILSARKAETERKISEIEQRITDCKEEIKELTAENIRRQGLGSSALLRVDINDFREEIDRLKTKKEKLKQKLSTIEDALFKFGTNDEKEPEEYN